MKKELLEFIETHSVFHDVNLLVEEPEILDIGGGIHNLARQNEIQYKGRLLVLNADQFFYMKKDDFFSRLKGFENDPLILFNYLVDPKDGYNALVCNEKREVVELKKNAEILNLPAVETYTGISLIDLSRLIPQEGPSKFFDSVCPFMKTKVNAILLEDVDYWDFGTVSRFWKTTYLIMDEAITNPNHPFIEFLIKHEALDLDKINPKKRNYFAESENVINLSDDYLIIPLEKSVVMNNTVVDLGAYEADSFIAWRDIIEIIPVGSA